MLLVDLASLFQQGSALLWALARLTGKITFLSPGVLVALPSFYTLSNVAFMQGENYWTTSRESGLMLRSVRLARANSVQENRIYLGAFFVMLPQVFGAGLRRLSAI